MVEIGRFLAMIGAIIRRPSDGKYLLLQRSASKDFAPNVWEVPSGRLDQGEGFIEALHREVWEETKLKVTVDFVVGLTHFYRGTAVAENEMVGVLFSCTALEPVEIEKSEEHSRFGWMTLEEAKKIDPPSDWLVRLLERDAEMRSCSSVTLCQLNQRAEYII